MRYFTIGFALMATSVSAQTVQCYQVGYQRVCREVYQPSGVIQQPTYNPGYEAALIQRQIELDRLRQQQRQMLCTQMQRQMGNC